jgi:hypothetical protein
MKRKREMIEEMRQMNQKRREWKQDGDYKKTRMRFPGLY